MDIANFSIEILTFLFIVGIIAGFLDTLVGGGGLLAVPALLLSGIPPIYARNEQVSGEYGNWHCYFFALS